MIKKSSLRSKLILIFIGIFGIIPFLFSQTNSFQPAAQKFASAIQTISLFYVDTVNPDKLVETAIVEVLKELDPHSQYISKAELDRVNEPLLGSFEGIGVTFQIYNDTILVISPVPGGPSDKLGILAGDKIVKIEEEDATGKKITNEWVMKRLRGKKGTIAKISIFRRGVKDLLEYEIVRDKIPLNSIDATHMIRPGIGYIKLNRFSRTSMEEFYESMANLKKMGMKSLILDLRGNSGGYLDVANTLSDQFLSEGKLIVYTEGVSSPRQNLTSSQAGEFETGKLVILIDEGSASASEIVTGAIQDWDRGLIIGRRSFGKGLVQRPFNLSDGSQIRLTTSRYYTPSGRSIQKPYEDGNEDYFKDLSERYKHGEFVHADSIKFPDSLKYETNGGRIVYGGGGIMPDIFIPLDSTLYNAYFSDLVRKGVFNKFTVDYLDKNRTALVSKYPDLSSFKAKFIVDNEIMAQFYEAAKSSGVEKKEEFKSPRSEEFIRLEIKALIARNLFDINSFFEVINEMDAAIESAIGFIEDDKEFKKFGIKY